MVAWGSELLALPAHPLFPDSHDTVSRLASPAMLRAHLPVTILPCSAPTAAAGPSSSPNDVVLALARSAQPSVSFDAWFAAVTAPQPPIADDGINTASMQRVRSIQPRTAGPPTSSVESRSSSLMVATRPPAQPIDSVGASLTAASPSYELCETLNSTARAARQSSNRLVSSSRARATISKYESHHRACVSFLKEAEHPHALPFDPELVADWIAHLADLGRSISTLESAVAAIRWIHVSQFHPDPTTSQRVRLTLEGAKRENARPVLHHSCLPQSFIVSLVESSVPSSSPHVLQLAAMVAVTFSTAVRISELLALLVSDLTFQHSGATIRVSVSKTDPLRVGSSRPIPAIPGSLRCPVAALRRYLASMQVPAATASYDNRPLWPNLTKSGEPSWGAGPLSAESANRALKRAIAASSLKPDVYSWHSIRVAVATTATRAGVQPELIQRIGNWKSQAFQTYCEAGQPLIRSLSARLWQVGQDPAFEPVDDSAADAATSLPASLTAGLYSDSLSPADDAPALACLLASSPTLPSDCMRPASSLAVVPCSAAEAASLTTAHSAFACAVAPTAAPHDLPPQLGCTIQRASTRPLSPNGSLASRSAVSRAQPSQPRAARHVQQLRSTSGVPHRAYHAPPLIGGEPLIFEFAPFLPTSMHHR